MPTTGQASQHSPAMLAAFAAIAHEFRHSPANHMARQWIKKSFGHPETRARFAFYIDWIVTWGLDLDQACMMAPPAGSASPVGKMIRAEAHLILRWMRRAKMHAAFAETVAAMADTSTPDVGGTHRSARTPVAPALDQIASGSAGSARVVAATSIIGGEFVVCVGDANGPVIERFPRTVAGHRAAVALAEAE